MSHPYAIHIGVWVCCFFFPRRAKLVSPRANSPSPLCTLPRTLLPFFSLSLLFLIFLPDLNKMPAPDIPTIDISALLDTNASHTDKQKVAVALLRAFTVYGVFYITSPTHPVFSTAKTHDILDATQRLFALDTADKAHIPKIMPGGFTRGYVPIGGESGSTTKELKEGFSYGYEWSEQDAAAKKHSFNGLQGPNSWPAPDTVARLDHGQSGSFKGTLDEFYLNVCDIAAGLLKGISLALDLPESELSKYCSSSETISFMRLFHYLPYADAQHASQIGSR